MTDSTTDSGYSAEELAHDESEPRRQLANAQTCLWDIDLDDLTEREKNRLITILDKIDDLEDIIEEREVAEKRAELAEEDDE